MIDFSDLGIQRYPVLHEVDFSFLIVLPTPRCSHHTLRKLVGHSIPMRLKINLRRWLGWTGDLKILDSLKVN
jgi:hypothetical protein